MKSQVLFVTIFLVCEVFCDGAKSVNQTNTNDHQPLKQDQLAAVAPVITNPLTNSVVHGEIKNDSNIKATTPKIVTNVDVPSSHSDVSDLIGDSMFSRAAYLLTGISVLVLIYFAWKSFSLRKRQTHIHKYGVVASREDLEMTSLGFGSEDEEDDTTHFDIGKHQRS